MCLFLINMIRHLLFLLCLTHMWDGRQLFVLFLKRIIWWKMLRFIVSKFTLCMCSTIKSFFFLIPFLIHMQTQLFCTCFESLYIFFCCSVKLHQSGIYDHLCLSNNNNNNIFFVYFMQTPCGSLPVRYRHVWNAWGEI